MELNQTTNEDNDDGTDILSDMPDNVLCKILSCLPTKEAVAVKILSTRWGSLDPFFWVSPIVLDLDDTWLSCNTSNDSFQKFMDKLLHDFHELQVIVDKLKLTCHSDYNVKKMSWISSVLQLNTRELSVECRCGAEVPKLPWFDILNGLAALTRLVLQGGIDRHLFIFSVDFVSPNLRTLILSGIRFVCTGCKFILPNLRTFDLHEVELYFPLHMEGNSLNELINSCPLEDLSLRRCTFNRDPLMKFPVLIRCPQLKDLTIENCSRCSFEIDVPNLKKFQIKHFAACTILSNFKSLLSAQIDIGYYASVDMLNLVTACSTTVNLYLSSSTMVRLPAKLQMFKNLNRLTLGHNRFEGWVQLAYLLYNAPKLEKLTFERGFSQQEEGYTLFEFVLARNPPVSCMELHIKEIEFCVFDENEDEMKLVEYFMNKGKVIETIKLRCLPFKNESTLGRLSTLPSHESKLVYQLRLR